MKGKYSPKEPGCLRNDGKWVLVYMGDQGDFENGEFYYEQVGYATADSLVGPYTKFAGNPFLAWGPPGTFDAGTIADAWVVEFHGTYYIGYTVSPTIFSPWQTAIAVTTDWQTFTKLGVTFPLGPAGAWDASTHSAGQSPASMTPTSCPTPATVTRWASPPSLCTRNTCPTIRT